MMEHQKKKQKKTLRIELTEEQKRLVQEATGKEATALEFRVDELEARLSPRFGYSLRRLKRNVAYLTAEDVQRLYAEVVSFRLATWQYRKDGPAAPTHLGFVIDDVGAGPAVAADGTTVDLYGFTSMAVAAIQAQAGQIAALRREVEELRRR
jgi:hypothetical protein